MQNLYDSLVNGEVEYKENGVMLTHAPTSTALRAARTIKYLADTNENNMQLILQLQSQVQQLLKEKDDSLHQSQQETSSVQCGDGGSPGSFNDSEGISTEAGSAGAGPIQE